MDYALIITNGLIFGGLLSLALGIIMSISFLIAADMWVGDYPPDIKAAYGEMSSRARQYRPWIGALFFGTLGAIVIAALVRLHALAPNLIGFWPVFWADFLTVFIVLMTFNLFDLLIIDWLIFVIIQPKLIVLPGTEGMESYKDYIFHLRAFGIGTIFSTAGALIITLVAALVMAVGRFF